MDAGHGPIKSPCFEAYLQRSHSIANVLDMIEASSLPSLRELDVDRGGRGGPDAYQRFLARTIAPLELIALSDIKSANLDGLIDVIIELHCGKLKNIKLGQDQALNSTTLSRLRVSCPNLERMDVGLHSSSS